MVNLFLFLIHHFLVTRIYSGDFGFFGFVGVFVTDVSIVDSETRRFQMLTARSQLANNLTLRNYTEF